MKKRKLKLSSTTLFVYKSKFVAGYGTTVSDPTTTTTTVVPTTS